MKKNTSPISLVRDESRTYINKDLYDLEDQLFNPKITVQSNKKE